jgi:hypothetical protein
MSSNEKAAGAANSAVSSGGATVESVADAAELREVLEAARLLASDAVAESCGGDADLVGDLAVEVLRLLTAAVESMELDPDAAATVLQRALGAADRRLRERRGLIRDRIERGGVEPPPAATERLP